MRNLFDLATMLFALGINLSSCKKESENESEYYIKGVFNGESVNYSMDTAYYYTTSRVL